MSVGSRVREMLARVSGIEPSSQVLVVSSFGICIGVCDIPHKGRSLLVPKKASAYTDKQPPDWTVLNEYTELDYHAFATFIEGEEEPRVNFAIILPENEDLVDIDSLMFVRVPPFQIGLPDDRP